MKFWLFVVVSVFAVVSAGCSNATTNVNTGSNTATVTNSSPAVSSSSSNSATTTAYPQDTVDAFLKSCQGAGSTPAFCTCVLKKVEAKYSYEEFQAIEGEIADGKPSKEFLAFTEKSRSDCLK